MVLKLQEGTTVESKIQKFGGSTYIKLEPELREYLGIDLETHDEAIVIIKLENSKKYGPYLGVGIKR